MKSKNIHCMPYFILTGILILTSFTSCHNEPEKSNPYIRNVQELVKFTLGEDTYILTYWGIETGPDLNVPPGLSRYIGQSSTPFTAISAYGTRHDGSAFRHYPYPGCPNIVLFNELIVYCDQWKRFDKSDEKNVLIIFDLRLNEIKRIEVPHTGVMRESNGHLIVINDDLEYSIFDKNFSVVATGTVNNNHDAIAGCFSYALESALPVFYFDGTSDIVSIIRTRTDKVSTIGYIVNLTSDSSVSVTWNFEKWGHWYPGHDPDPDPFSIGSELEDWPFVLPYGIWRWNSKGLRPFFDETRHRFVYPCKINGTDGDPTDISFSANSGTESHAFIDLNGKISFD